MGWASTALSRLRIWAMGFGCAQPTEGIGRGILAAGLADYGRCGTGGVGGEIWWVGDDSEEFNFSVSISTPSGGFDESGSVRK
jgi:hypothetical protein